MELNKSPLCISRIYNEVLSILGLQKKDTLGSVNQMYLTIALLFPRESHGICVK